MTVTSKPRMSPRAISLFYEIPGRRASQPGRQDPASAGLSDRAESEHIAMRRTNPDGTTTPLTLPNHANLKGSTLRAICTQAQIPREEFLRAYERS
jgi:hypothetical protein